MRREDYASVREMPAAEGWRAVALIDTNGYVLATYSARLPQWDDGILDLLMARAVPAKPRLRVVE